MDTSISNRRIVTSLLVSLLLIVGFYMFMEAVFRYSVAHADGSSIGSGIATSPVTAAPVSAVPTVDVTDPLSDWQMVKTYGWVWGGMIVAAGGLVLFGKKNEEEHWVNKNNRVLLVLMGLAGVISSVLVAHFDHAGYAGVVATAFGAIKLSIFPPKAAG